VKPFVNFAKHFLAKQSIHPPQADNIRNCLRAFARVLRISPSSPCGISLCEPLRGFHWAGLERINIVKPANGRF